MNYRSCPILGGHYTIQQFEDALRIDPDNTYVRNSYARCLEKHGRYREALEQYQAVLKKKPKQEHALGGAAKLLCKLNRFPEAQEYFDRALDINRENLHILVPYAANLIKEGVVERAREIVSQLESLAPNRRDVIHLRKQLNNQVGRVEPKDAPTLGNYDQARRLFDKATKKKELGNYEEACRLFDEATKLNPKSAYVWQTWALVERELGYYNRARRLFKEALRVDPKHAYSWQTWAIMEKELGNYDIARQLFSAATKVQPENPSGWQPWALLELDQGNYVEALRLAQHTVELAPDDFYGYMARGQVQSVLGKHLEASADFDKARREIESQLEQQSKDSRLLNILGRVLTFLEDYEQAEAILCRSLELSPDHKKHYAHNGLGELYEAQGLIRKAITQWEKAVGYSPYYLTAYNNLKRMQLQTSYIMQELPVRVDDESYDESKLEDIIKYFKKLSDKPYIKFFREDRGFGFIARPDEPDLFFHISKVVNPEAIEIGANVTFEVKSSPKGPQAIQVSIVETSEPEAASEGRPSAASTEPA